MLCLKSPKSASKHRGITSILFGEVGGGVPEYFSSEKFFNKWVWAVCLGIFGRRNFRTFTIFSGLVTLTEMKAKQEDVVKLREKQLAKKDAESRLKEKIKADKKKKEKMKVC